MKNKKLMERIMFEKISILLFLIVFIILPTLAFAIPDSLTLQGKLTNLDGTAQVGAFNFSFKVYDSYTDGNILLQRNINITTDANGIYDVILYNLSSLNFSEQYYLGITVKTDNESTPRINLTSTPYSFRANVSEDLNRENKYEISALNITGNLTLGDSFADALAITTGRLNISDGDIKAAGNLTIAEKITFSLGQIIDNLVNGFLRISGNLNVTGNTSIAQTLFVDNTSGRVGIGTTEPAEKLVVIGKVNISDSLNVSNTIQATTFVGDGSLLTGISSTSSWNSSGTNVFLNDTNALVGIGTTNPETKLHINISDTENTSTTTLLTLDHVLANPVNSTGGVGVSVLFRATDNASQLYKIANISAVLYNATNGSQLGALTFSTSGADTGDGSFGHTIERMRIDGYGRVGINNTAPNETLALRGTLSVVSGSGTQGLFQDSTGNVAIGTTSPTQGKLEVAGNITAKYDAGTFPGYVFGHKDSSDNVVFGFYRGGTGSNSLIIRSFNEIGFAPNNANTILMNLDASGRLGVNTTVPAQTLTVQGTLNVTPAGQGSTPSIFATSSGNLGIGTTSPASLLEVDGTANITSSSTQFLVDSNGDVTINLKG